MVGVDTSFAISHTWVGDLLVQLCIKSGDCVNLWTNEGGPADFASRSITGIQAFDGEIVDQKWLLYAYDLVPRDTGKLNWWRLTLYTDP